MAIEIQISRKTNIYNIFSSAGESILLLLWAIFTWIAVPCPWMLLWRGWSLWMCKYCHIPVKNNLSQLPVSQSSSTILYMCLTHISILHFLSGYNFELSGMRGSVTSPQYPRNYPLNVTCKWTITAIRQRRIQIHFTDFSLEKNKKCLYDYLQIRESQTSSGRKIISRPTPKYCGYSLPQDYLSQGDQVEIIFVSDPMSEVDKGFRLIWTTVPTGSTEAPTELPSTPSLTSGILRVSVITLNWFSVKSYLSLFLFK